MNTKTIQGDSVSRSDDIGAPDMESLAGRIAYQLTKRLVIDISTARAAVDAAIKDAA